MVGGTQSLTAGYKMNVLQPSDGSALLDLLGLAGEAWQATCEETLVNCVRNFGVEVDCVGLAVELESMNAIFWA